MGLFTKSSSPSRSTAASSAVSSAPPPQVWTFPVPEFHPIHYVPRADKDAILQQPVLWASAVAHGLLETGGNHWCFYLVIGDNESVRVDPSPSNVPGVMIPGGSKANIIVSLLDYLVSNRYEHISTIKTAKGVTVGHFIDAVIRNGREKYEFDVNGRGCRYWTSQQIALFLQLGLFVDGREAAAAQNSILVEYNKRKPTGRQYGLVEGAYYK